MSPSTRRFFARTAPALLALAALSMPGSASAGEIQVAAGPGVYGSSWRGDATGGSALRLGYRFADVIAVDYIGRLGYGTVNDRVITYLSLGATVYGRVWKLRPYARLAFVHQHEESTSAVKDDPWGATFGVGDGIRHRGGGGTSLGLDLPLMKTKVVELTLGIDSSAAYFPDPRGPKVYAGGALWLGMNFGI